MAYFVITGKDTTGFTCIFTESNKNGAIGIILNAGSSKTCRTYRQKLEELKIIFPKAAQDFDFKLLTSIELGRLIFSGDLAVEVTEEYQKKFPSGNRHIDYSALGEFLKKSRLGSDFNKLFQNYPVTVSGVSAEKAFFAPKAQLLRQCKIETAPSIIPDKTLDCMTWIRLTRK